MTRPQKRKVAKASKATVPAKNASESDEVVSEMTNSVAAVVQNAQLKEAFHAKYVKELTAIYKKVSISL